MNATALRPAPYLATRFEAFKLSKRTYLLDPLEAGTLSQALAETTARWAWDRGDRLAVREIGEGRDLLHIYAVRRKSAGTEVWSRFIPAKEYERWLDHICTADLNEIAGLPNGRIGAEVELHRRRQADRPEGARMERECVVDGRVLG